MKTEKDDECMDDGDEVLVSLFCLQSRRMSQLAALKDSPFQRQNKIQHLIKRYN